MSATTLIATLAALCWLIAIADAVAILAWLYAQAKHPEVR